MTEAQKMAALLDTDTATETHAKCTAVPTKEEDVLRALTHDSLNRFEAERIGDHCLNSTVSQLRKKGIVILDEWERVPTRGARGYTPVKRYWVAPEPKNLARVRSLLGSEQGGE
ncbi:hypothetical protein KYG_11884 [Acidovorax sp. NO-1]|jgi:hypothetical protein|uniref:hypothetical protein n=1 Tax=Acidovorax sp. NO-1 TaxID=512030 RepID=UPI00023FD263|nr:hypothetical protein [Acidovorax sp. NO-1]EHL22554.1 hypothetical protein KYG_11884 [Acidovorax sp. NO-1]